MKKNINEKDIDSTFNKIIKTSIRLFSKKWYSTVSIAEICRKSNISNGLFYHYFSNKEELIKHILDKTVSEIQNMLENIEGKNVLEKISNLIDKMYNYTSSNKELILVFREGQYRYFEYERKLVNIYTNSLKRILNKDITLPIYLYIFGGIRWFCIRKALYGSNLSKEACIDIIFNGIFNDLEVDISKIFNQTIKLPEIKYPYESKEKIIEAGKSLFGENEYDEVNIHHITEKANYAIGTFYKYFKSKESFFEYLVEISGKQIRHFISENLGENLNRLERELRGIFLFLNYLKFDRNCYNIVREAEFVKPSKAKEYYEGFIKGYKKDEYFYTKKDNINKFPSYVDTVIEYLLGIAHYFGIEFIFDNQNIDLISTLEHLSILLKNGLRGLNL